jgi:bacterioferritin (cytochrome b1)
MVNTSLLSEMSITIAKEEELSMQCMWQHHLLQGTALETIGSILMQLAINESMRVEIIARILGCLGQPPLKKREMSLTEKTDNPEEMLRRDRDLLDEIIVSYNRVLALAQNEEGCLLREYCVALLDDEEKHRVMLGALLTTPATEAFMTTSSTDGDVANRVAEDPREGLAVGKCSEHEDGAS